MLFRSAVWRVQVREGSACTAAHFPFASPLCRHAASLNPSQSSRVSRAAHRLITFVIRPCLWLRCLDCTPWEREMEDAFCAVSRLARSRWFRPRAFHGTRANLKWFLVRHLSAINVPLLVMNVPHEDIACRPCGRNGCGRLLASVSEQYSELGQIASTTHIEGQIGIRNLAVIWLGLCPCLDRKIFERVGDCMCAVATAYAVTGFGKFWRIEAVAALSVRPSLRLVSFLYFRWRCSARFARTSIFHHLHSWASVAAPAFPRPAHHFDPVPSSYLPPRLHGFMHHHLLPPPQPFAPPGQFECAWTSGCVVWISWRCVCLECTQAERKTARRCGACQRGQVTEAGFCLALCCSCWLCIYYCCIGEALAQGRGGMLEAEWQLEGGARVTGTRRAAALVWSLSLWGFDVCQGAEQLSSHCARSPSLRSW